VEVLAGGGPADLVEVTLALAREMVALAGVDADPAEALADGRAMDRWRAIVAAQGGDPDAPLPMAAETETVTADADGVIQHLDARAVGVAAWRLGAGRARKEDEVSATAGVVCHAKVGDTVRTGDPVLELRTDEPERFAAAREALAGAWVIGPDPAEPPPLLLDRITA
jgi:thymidine phosphorylase